MLRLSHLYIRPNGGHHLDLGQGHTRIRHRQRVPDTSNVFPSIIRVFSIIKALFTTIFIYLFKFYSIQPFGFMTDLKCLCIHDIAWLCAPYFSISAISRHYDRLRLYNHMAQARNAISSYNLSTHHHQIQTLSRGREGVFDYGGTYLGCR